MPVLCTEEKKKDEDDDDLTEPTLIDGSLGLRHECLCAWMLCVCMHTHSVQTKSL